MLTAGQSRPHRRVFAAIAVCVLVAHAWLLGTIDVGLGGGRGGRFGFPSGDERGGRGGGIMSVGGANMPVGGANMPVPGGTPPAGVVPPGTETQPGQTQTVVKPKPRYEFVVMFIWREPTPSDALMKLGDAAAAGAAGAPPAGP